MPLPRDKLLPIEYNDWDAAGDAMDLQFYGATFLEDFGIFKKGQKIEILVILGTNGLLQEVAENGEVVREMEIKLTPA